MFEGCSKYLESQYDNSGNLWKEYDRLRNLTTHTYSPTGKPVVTTFADGKAMTMGYDARDWLVSTIHAGGTIATGGILSQMTQQEYYADGRLKRTIDPLLRDQVIQTYDDDGRSFEAFTPAPNTASVSVKSWNEYTDRGEVKFAHDPSNHFTEFAYDENGNLKDRWNRRLGADRGRWQFTYDKDGHPTDTISPMARHTTQHYWPSGVLRNINKPSGASVEFGFDAVDRLSTTLDSAGYVNYFRDERARVESVHDGGPGYPAINSGISYFDELGRLTKYVHSALPGLPATGYTLQWIYHDTDTTNKNAYTLKYPDGRPVRYDFDSRGRLFKVTDWNLITTYSYDKLGRLEWTIRPNGTKRRVTYDNGNQITRIEETDASGSANPIVRLDYPSYRGNGQVGQETITLRTPFANVAQPTIPTMTYDRDDRVKDWNTNPVAHDLDGNMTNGPIPGQNNPIMGTFAYDVRNRLTSCGGVTYGYDPENARIKVISGGVTQAWVINPVNGQPLVRTVNGVTTWYVWGLGLLYEYDSTNGYKTYHYDRRGSTVALTGSGGNITDRWCYGPYGERLAREGVTDTPFQFNGFYGVQTDANGLLYMRARYYNVEMRRFISSDPAGFGAGSNFYAFVNGDPISLIDPFGLCACDAARSIGREIRNFGNDAYFAAGDAVLNVGIGGAGFLSSAVGYALDATGLAPGNHLIGQGEAILGAMSPLARAGNYNSDSFTSMVVQVGSIFFGGEISTAAKEGLALTTADLSAGAKSALGRGLGSTPGAPLTEAQLAGLQNNLDASLVNAAKALKNPNIPNAAGQFNKGVDRVETILDTVNSGVGAPRR